MYYSLILSNLIRLFLLVVLSGAFYSNTYAYYSRIQATTAPDTIPETTVGQMVEPGKKRAGFGMISGFASILTHKVGFIVVAPGTIKSPAFFIIGGILGLAAMILGISSLSEVKKAKALNRAEDGKSFKKSTKRMAITSIILGVLGVALAVVLTSAYYYFL